MSSSPTLSLTELISTSKTLAFFSVQADLTLYICNMSTQPEAHTFTVRTFPPLAQLCFKMI